MATTPEDTNARKPRTWTRDELAAWLTSNDTFELAFRAGRVAPFGRPSPAMVTAIVEALAAAVPVEFREVVAGEPEAREAGADARELDELENYLAATLTSRSFEGIGVEELREYVIALAPFIRELAAGEPEGQYVADETENGDPIVLETRSSLSGIVAMCRSTAMAERIASLLNAAAGEPDDEATIAKLLDDDGPCLGVMVQAVAHMRHQGMTGKGDVGRARDILLNLAAVLRSASDHEGSGA